jgi:hypothetical protein
MLLSTGTGCLFYPVTPQIAIPIHPVRFNVCMYSQYAKLQNLYRMHEYRIGRLHTRVLETRDERGRIKIENWTIHTRGRR